MRFVSYSPTTFAICMSTSTGVDWPLNHRSITVSIESIASTAAAAWTGFGVLMRPPPCGAPDTQRLPREQRDSTTSTGTRNRGSRLHRPDRTGSRGGNVAGEIFERCPGAGNVLVIGPVTQGGPTSRISSQSSFAPCSVEVAALLPELLENLSAEYVIAVIPSGALHVLGYQLFFPVARVYVAVEEVAQHVRFPGEHIVTHVTPPNGELAGGVVMMSNQQKLPLLGRNVMWR